MASAKILCPVHGGWALGSPEIKLFAEHLRGLLGGSGPRAMGRTPRARTGWGGHYRSGIKEV